MGRYAPQQSLKPVAALRHRAHNDVGEPTKRVLAGSSRPTQRGELRGFLAVIRIRNELKELLDTFPATPNQECISQIDWSLLVDAICHEHEVLVR